MRWARPEKKASRAWNCAVVRFCGSLLPSRAAIRCTNSLLRSVTSSSSISLVSAQKNSRPVSSSWPEMLPIFRPNSAVSFSLTSFFCIMCPFLLRLAYCTDAQRLVVRNPSHDIPQRIGNQLRMLAEQAGEVVLVPVAPDAVAGRHHDAFPGERGCQHRDRAMFAPEYTGREGDMLHAFLVVDVRAHVANAGDTQLLAGEVDLAGDGDRPAAVVELPVHCGEQAGGRFLVGQMHGEVGRRRLRLGAVPEAVQVQPAQQLAVPLQVDAVAVVAFVGE